MEDAIVAAYKHELGGMPVVPVAFQAWIRALYRCTHLLKQDGVSSR
jgi:hypothetical protein